MAVTSRRFPARLWLRVDALEPLTCSVRFSLDQGEGYLVWRAAPESTARAGSRTGAAGGLTIADLPALTLVHRPHPSRLWERTPLPLPQLPADARTRLGEWVAVDPAANPEADATDLVFATDVLETDLPDDDTGPDVAELESSPTPVPVEITDDIDVLDEAITLPGTAMEPADTPSRPGASSSTLVRSLVRRIRIQEEEIKALKLQVASLQTRLDAARS